MEKKESRKVEFAQQQRKKSFYERKEKKEYKSQGFGIDNNRMWDDDI